MNLSQTIRHGSAWQVQRGASHPPRVWLGLALASILLAASASPVSAAKGCGATALASGDPDASYALVLPAFTGRAWGEIFVAQDTILQAVTVWRPAIPLGDLFARQLFITTTTPYINGQLRPVLESILYVSAPMVVEPISDGIHAVPYRFEIDPPLVLPGRGFYFFTIQSPGCFFIANIVADTLDLYPQGYVWKVLPNFDCSFGGALGFPQTPSTDLVFSIEFCESPTTARKDTWGRLKARYR